MSNETALTVQKVALYLGLPWKYNHLHTSNWSFEIIDGAGRGLFFSMDSQKFRISGNFPCGRYYSEYGEYKAIGVSASRPAKDIAADIERRLLPYYLKAYAQAKEAKQKRQEEKEHLELIAQVLCRVTGGRVQSQSRAAHTIYFEEGHIELWHNNDVTMQLNRLTADQAIKVIAALRKD